MICIFQEEDNVPNESRVHLGEKREIRIKTSDRCSIKTRQRNMDLFTVIHRESFYVLGKNMVYKVMF